VGMGTLVPVGYQSKGKQKKKGNPGTKRVFCKRGGKKLKKKRGNGELRWAGTGAGALTRFLSFWSKTGTKRGTMRGEGLGPLLSQVSGVIPRGGADPVGDRQKRDR